MNGKDLHNAMEFVGYDLIDLAEKQRFSRPVFRALLPAAAALAILIGSASVLLPRPQVPTAVSPDQQEVATESEAPVPVLPDESETVQPERHPLHAIFPQLDTHTLPADAADWNTFYLNETGLEDPAAGIFTSQGDPVLAIDAANGILLIRVQGEDYRGVLAIAKDPTRLSLQPSSQIDISGETVGTIAEAHDAVLAINGSRPRSDEGAYGSVMSGYTMCDGVEYCIGEHLDANAVRLEVNTTGQFCLTDPQAPVSADTQNALEVPLALIRDGENVVTDGWNGTHPRSCIGQTADGTVLMLVIEGRLMEYSLGTDADTCAEILLRYGCETAIQLDTGTSCMLWFDGACVTRCSNRALPEGCPLPCAFVITR